MNVHAVNIGSDKMDGGEDEATERMGEATLSFLAAVDDGAPMSQRSLAGRLGVALGLANALVRRCVHKGYVKISSAPARRYAYYLTPAGFAEKSRLVGEFIESSLSFFRSTRVEFAQCFTAAARAGHRRSLIAGSGELAEIALLAAEDSGIELVGVLDATRNAATFHGIKVARSLDEAPAFDVIILADSRAQAAFDRLVTQYPADLILTPGMLHVSRERIGGAE